VHERAWLCLAMAVDMALAPSLQGAQQAPVPAALGVPPAVITTKLYKDLATTLT
jgi:hypothetical protein